MDGRGAEPHDRGQIDDRVKHQPEYAHRVFHRRAKSRFQKLRHGVDAAFQENWQRKLPHENERDRRHPFIGRNR